MNRLQMLCRRALCVPIRTYQYTLSPWIGRSCRFYAQLQQLHHAGHPDPRLHKRHSAGRMAHCPVQSLGKWGYDPCRRPAAGKTLPAACSPQSCFPHGTSERWKNRGFLRKFNAFCSACASAAARKAVGLHTKNRRCARGFFVFRRFEVAARRPQPTAANAVFRYDPLW